MVGPEAAVLYWHIGATMMRLRRVVLRIVKGWKRVGGEEFDFSSWTMVPGDDMCWGVKYSRPGTPRLRSCGAMMEGLV